MRYPKLLTAVLLMSACTLNAGEQVTETAVTFTPQVDETEVVEPTSQATNAPTSTSQPIPTLGGGTCTPRADWTIIYVVVSGDTLGQIAERTSTTVNDIAAANCLANVNAISVGQQLRVPRAPVALPPPTATATQAQVPVPTVQTAPLGSINISSFVAADAGNYSLLRGETITLRWDDAPANLSSAAFFLLKRAPGGGPFISNVQIGEDTTPADGFSISWLVPGGVSDELLAVGRSSAGVQTAVSNSQSVYSVPTFGQGCMLSATSADVTIYTEPDTSSAVAGTLTSSMSVEQLGRSLNGWYAIDPTLQNGGTTSYSKLRWIPVDAALKTTGNC